MSAIKQRETFLQLSKKMANKSCFGLKKKQHGRAVDPGALHKTNMDIKYLETNLALVWKFPNDATFV